MQSFDARGGAYLLLVDTGRTRPSAVGGRGAAGRGLLAGFAAGVVDGAKLDIGGRRSGRGGAGGSGLA